MSQENDQKQWWFMEVDGATHKVTYLHFIKLGETTTNPHHAWQGNQRQALNVRAKFPHARLLPLVRKSHKQNPQ